MLIRLRIHRPSLLLRLAAVGSRGPLAALFLVVLLALPSAPGNAAVDSASSEQGRGFERLIARTVSLRFPAIHYSHQELNDDASRQLFEEYFSLLDPQHSYFLAEDLESFAHLRDRLDNLLKMGRIHFAFEVYELYLKRVRERIDFVSRLLEDGIDLTLEEYYVPDRSEADWPADKEARDTLWRKQAKNLLLTYSMMERDADRDGAEDSPATDPESDDPKTQDKNGSGETAAAPETSDIENEPSSDPNALNRPDDSDEAQPGETEASGSPAARKTPEQRVLDFHERHLALMEERETIEILEFFLVALARVYDPHSSYMAPDTEEDFDIHMKLSLEGIGALLTTEDGYVKVADVIAGGPAQQDGRLQPGDRIIEVSEGGKESVDVINMPLRKVVDLIRGPKGTEVILTVIEAEKGLGAVPVQIEIVRDEVKLKEQEAKAEVVPLTDFGTRADDGDKQTAPSRRILLISLPSFYRDFEAEKQGDAQFKSSARDVRRLIEEQLDSAAIDGIILDLRGNGGGSLTEAVDVAGLFFAKGPIVQARYSNGDVRVLRDKDGETTFSGPLTVLVDRRSASASEIVAAVLQDMGRALVVGSESTHGKGSIQTLYHLAREFNRLPAPFNKKQPGTLKITVGKFYRINGGATQLRGVQPDIVFPDYSDHLDLGERSLSNPLPWDSIKPVAYNSENSVNPMLPQLKERSKARNANSSAYAKRLERIHLFAERQQLKRVPLQREARMAYHENQQQLVDLLDDQTESAPAEPTDEDGAADEADENEADKDKDGPVLWDDDDYVLSEACRILSDLIRLRKGEPLCDIKRQLTAAGERLAQETDDADAEGKTADVAQSNVSD